MEHPAESASRAAGGDDERVRLARARAGDLAAFEEIVERHQRRVYAVAYRIVRRHDVADDVTQEAFVRAWQKLESFDLARPFAPWISRIAANLAVSQVRSPRWREDPLPDHEGSAGSERAPGPLEGVLEDEARQKLESALEALSPEQRAVFVLRTAEELSYQEIAETLELSIGTVMSRLSRAREKLREALKDYLAPAGEWRAREAGGRS